MAQKLKYNGKEINQELGLDWYDCGARNYDATSKTVTTVTNTVKKEQEQNIPQN